MRTNHTSSRWLLLLVATVLFSSGCGGEDEPATGGESPSAGAAGVAGAAGAAGAAGGGGDGGSGGASAGAAGSSGELAAELPLSIAVDKALKPKVESWPGLDGETSRPVAAVTGPGGKVCSFVADELILSYTDPAERDAFVAKWSGEVLLEIDPAKHGVLDLPSMALVRVKTAAASVEQFLPAARKLAPRVSGDHRVSSEQALELLTAAMTENAAGRAVSINWIGESTGFLDRQVSESATSDSLDPHNPNPYGWGYLRAGSTQNIGVTEAWRALALEGKLDNRVKIAILDGGFAPDADFPASYKSESVVLWKSPTGSTNPTSCSGGAACDYHGTSVLHTAAGVVDNGFGTAGTGGPVAEAISVVTIPDSITSISAMLKAVERGAEIINMSFRMTVPSILAVTVLAQNSTTKALSNQGIMLFAAAGNDGESVDSEECFTLCVPFSDTYCWKDCFETYWHAPCENDGVTCIGGLAMGQRSRATNSNFGLENVRLFAPYTVFVGAAPDNPDPLRTISGTSFSSPYVAGVAALVKAANPALSGQEVIKILQDTAHGSSDPVVPGYVNALAAVQAALGDVRPTLRILAPTDGSSSGVTGLSSTMLIATSEDYEDGIDAVSVSWESDLEGPLGVGHTREASLTKIGTHTITATATDSGGNVAKQSVKLVIENSPPSVVITSPVGSSVTVGVPFVAAASTWDLESFGSLPCENVSWSLENISSKKVTDLGAGCAILVTVPTTDLYLLTAVAKDNQGATTTAPIKALVPKDMPASGPPFVSIVQPATSTLLEPLKVAKLVGTAIDPDDPSGSFPLSYTWTGKVGAGAPFVIGSGPIVEWTPGNDVPSGCGDKTVELTLTVQDGGGETTVKKATVYVFFPPC